MKLTHLQEQALQLAGSLHYHKEWLSSDQIGKTFDWLKTISGDGVECYLSIGLKKGWIKDKARGPVLFYQATPQGAIDYKSHFGS